MLHWLPTIIGVIVAAVSWYFTFHYKRELWRWANVCNHARIAIAYNRKTQLQAPLTEWVTWANALDKDEASRGRVVYRNGKVTVFITRLRKENEPTTETRTIKEKETA